MRSLIHPAEKVSGAILSHQRNPHISPSADTTRRPCRTTLGGRRRRRLARGTARLKARNHATLGRRLAIGGRIAARGRAHAARVREHGPNTCVCHRPTTDTGTALQPGTGHALAPPIRSRPILFVSDGRISLCVLCFGGTTEARRLTGLPRGGGIGGAHYSRLGQHLPCLDGTANRRKLL